MEPIWTWVVIGGPILLALAFAYGMFRNKGRDRRMDAVTEQATHDLYQREANTPPSSRDG